MARDENLTARAINLVSFRPRSRKEITDFLERAKAGPEAVAKTLETLERLDYLDDGKFARWWIEQRLKHRPKGAAVLKMELRAKGIDRAVAEAALQETDFKSQEPDLAKALLAKKLPLWRNLPPLKQKQRVYSFLARRGFSAQVIRDLVDGLGWEE